MCPEVESQKLSIEIDIGNFALGLFTLHCQTDTHPAIGGAVMPYLLLTGQLALTLNGITKHIMDASTIYIISYLTCRLILILCYLSDDNLSGSGDRSGSGIDDPDDQLQQTKDTYIYLVSYSQMVTEEARVAPASSSQPQTISTASDAHHVRFLTRLFWLISTWAVIFAA